MPIKGHYFSNVFIAEGFYAFVDFGIGRDKAIEDHLHSERSLDGDNSRGKFLSGQLEAR